MSHKRIDIALVTNTHFTKYSSIFIPDYSLLKYNHPNGTVNDGVATFTKNKLKHYPLSNYFQNHIQSCAISITLLNIPIVIASIYSPPRRSLTNIDLTNYFETMPNYFIIGGDYNSKHQSWGSRVINPRYNLLYNFVNLNKYKTILLQGPTYSPTFLKKNLDILDIFVTKIPSNLYRTVNNSLYLNSGHSSVILNINATPQLYNDRIFLFFIND